MHTLQGGGYCWFFYSFRCIQVGEVSIWVFGLLCSQIVDLPQFTVHFSAFKVNAEPKSSVHTLECTCTIMLVLPSEYFFGLCSRMSLIFFLFFSSFVVHFLVLFRFYTQEIIQASGYCSCQVHSALTEKNTELLNFVDPTVSKELSL